MVVSSIDIFFTISSLLYNIVPFGGG